MTMLGCTFDDTGRTFFLEFLTKAKKIDMTEPILQDSTRRFNLFPIKYPELFQRYKTLQSSFWVPEEVDLESDIEEFQKLDKKEKTFLSYVLAFFASADCIVNLNILNFQNEITLPECVCFWATQAAQESVHAEVYGQLIDRLVPNAQEKDKLFNAIEQIDAVKSKGEWAIKWLDDSIALPLRIVGWIIVEGIMFCSSFAAIAYFKHRNLLKGLTEVNQWISRDESNHCSYGCLLIKKYVHNRPSTEVVHEMFSDAVHHEFEFIDNAMKGRLIGMDPDDMKVYVRYCCNRILTEMGYPHMYDQKEAFCPWDWIRMLSMEGQSSFFERRVTDYAKSTVTKSNIDFSADF